MNIELRRVTFAARLSEETNAYAAQVWVDGEHIADVKNDGHGGPDYQYPAKGKTHADVNKLNEACKQQFGKETFKAGPDTFEIEMDLEQVCGKLLARHLAEKDFKRSLSRSWLYVRDGKCYKVTKAKGAVAAQQLELIKQRNNITQTLNEMPVGEALELFTKTAA